MSSTYNGSLSGIAYRDHASVTVPADADARTAESVNAALRKLTDLVEYLMQKAGIVDHVGSWSGAQAFDDVTITGTLETLTALIDSLNVPVPLLGTNPAASTGIKNALRMNNLVKAWGHLTTSGGVVTLAAGMNVDTPTIDGGTTSIAVPFPALCGMADANYVVHAAQRIAGASTGGLYAAVHSHATGSFKIKCFDAANAVLDPASAVLSIDFVVFGNQTP